ncbi:N-acetylmuramoyl-L-alanine amidase [Paenibacillus sophorae]|uniref:N-acetylmuramoyl-L-alanine amidase n=1 Tax=Paenibacillus sophorae TaxID=1333845 RepID=A0A1H8NJL1_9BACL|nr:N-acetylmuramoyl-L-alanine amidase family protein [Paenibacillus sophorae]QWU14581.1 N-acetylmuramoyl-L-alanine amidase family protein [Paenibacillus sophorae]SEO29921.1 N-acetylmuramoyl-L-alanine amidase [Paenibacillus sophorae]
MKKLSFLLLVLLFVLVKPENGHAATGNNKIFLDGKELTAGQSVPVENVNGTVMVPLRMIVQSLGYKVDWNQNAKTVTISQQGKVISLVVGQKTAIVDGNEVPLNEAPVLRNDTSLVPIRFISEQFGLKVEWDNKEKTVTITTPQTSADDSSSTDNTPSTDGSSSGDGTSPEVPLNGSASNLTKVNGVSFSNNQLLIAISGDSAPKLSVLDGPARIVVDIPNASFSDSFASGQNLPPDQKSTLDATGYPDVKEIRYSLYSSNPYMVRFVIELSGSKDFGYSLSATDSSSKLAIIDLNGTGGLAAAAAGTGADVTTGPPDRGGKKLVVLDAGHGAKDSGAVGVTGKYEKNFNLAVVLKAEALLKQEANIEVVLTRSDDTFLELKDRAAIANNLNADLFISVHANSSPTTAASGTETYYKRDESKAFAAVMHKYLVQATGLSDRGVQYGNFHVIRETKMPAILLEAGYLSNKKDEALLFTEALQDKVAAAIVSGIKEYLGIS